MAKIAPLAVPSSFARMMPLHFTDFENCSACATAFCPKVASDEQDLVWCAGHLLRDDAMDLLEFLHEVRLRVQPPAVSTMRTSKLRASPSRRRREPRPMGRPPVPA